MDPLETWRPPAGENPSSLQDFLQAFEPPNPGFPRSPASAHGGSWTSYAFVAGIGKPSCGQMRHHTGNTLLTNAVKPHRSLSSKAGLRTEERRVRIGSGCRG